VRESGGDRLIVVVAVAVLEADMDAVVVIVRFGEAERRVDAVNEADADWVREGAWERVPVGDAVGVRLVRVVVVVVGDIEVVLEDDVVEVAVRVCDVDRVEVVEPVAVLEEEGDGVVTEVAVEDFVVRAVAVVRPEDRIVRLRKDDHVGIGVGRADRVEVVVLVLVFEAVVVDVVKSGPLTKIR